jgi:O-antigen/teichoic acid export membrane protein
MFLLGVAGTMIVIPISPWLVERTLKVPGDLQTETLNAFYLMALSIPLVIVTTGLRGLLEAHQCFGLSNALRVPMGVFTFLGPLLVLPFSRSLVPVLAVLLAGRVAGCAAYGWACLKTIPGLQRRLALNRSFIRPLLRFGGWMTVSNLVSPMMVTLDRFLVGALLSIVAVTYYVTPFEAVTKVLVIPAALMGVIFPAFSTSSVRDRGYTSLLFERSINGTAAVLFPIVLFIVVFAQNGLKIWLGRDFAEHSARVLQLIGIGVFVNSLACVPFAFLQGVGRPDVTGILNLLELPFYLAAVWGLTVVRGIEGTALAWTLRMMVDGAALFVLSAKIVPESAPAVRRTAFTMVGAVLTLILSISLPGLELKAIFLLTVLGGSAFLLRRRIGSSAEWLVAQAPIALRREP